MAGQPETSVESPGTGSAAVPFEPRRYLDEYFLDVDPEYLGLYGFWCAALAPLPTGLRGLDVGSGPTLYSSLCLAARCSEIDVADFVPESLREVERWLRREPGSFDWSAHTRLVLQAEGAGTGPADVAAREDALRNALRGLLPCDIRSPLPLGGPAEPYDVVTAHYCIEMATSCPAEWARSLGHACGLVKPGGLLLVSSAVEMHLLRVFRDEPVHPAANVSIDDARRALGAAGMDVGQARIELLPAPEGRPYSATLLVAARRPPTPPA